MASSSVDFNPWIMWQPDKPQDLPTKQLLQVGEGMIRNGIFFEVPPTHIYMVTNANEDEEDSQWQWQNSSPRQIGIQPYKESNYAYSTEIMETPDTKTVEKNLASADRIYAPITFESEARITSETLAEDWTAEGDDDHIKNFNVDSGTIPANINLILDETVYKGKTVTTPH
jgi:hypothetical protein